MVSKNRLSVERYQEAKDEDEEHLELAQEMLLEEHRSGYGEEQGDEMDEVNYVPHIDAFESYDQLPMDERSSSDNGKSDPESLSPS